jgi:hypothetical protein
LVVLRDRGEIGEGVLRQIQSELDLEQVRLETRADGQAGLAPPVGE